jgi:hypothetical protein
MDPKLSRRPDGVTFNVLSGRVFTVLNRYTVFPWPVMMAQCKRVGADPASLTTDDLKRALPHLVAGVSRFTDPQKAAAAERELVTLTRA